MSQTDDAYFPKTPRQIVDGDRNHVLIGSSWHSIQVRLPVADYCACRVIRSDDS